MRAITILTLPLALGGCSLLPGQSGDDARLFGDDQALAQTQSESAAKVLEEEADPKTIPQSFLGTWDYVLNDCAPGGNLLVKMEPQRVAFVDGFGEVAQVKRVNDTAIDVQMVMKGTAEEWTSHSRFVLVEDGDMMTHSEDPSRGAQDGFALKRCG
jgi:hypothetical protein